GLEGERLIVMVVSSQRDGWPGGVTEGLGGPDGEHDTRGAARAAAVLALAAFVDGFVPAADEHLAPALAVAGGAVRLPHLVPARLDGGSKRAGEGDEGAHYSTRLAGSRVRRRSASVSAHSMSCTVRVMFRLMSWPARSRAWSIVSTSPGLPRARRPAR